MSINPLGVVVTADLNCSTEVRRLDNTLKVSNWVKYRLPGFSKMIGLSLGRGLTEVVVGSLQFQ